MSQSAAIKEWKLPAPRKALQEALEARFAGRTGHYSLSPVDRAIYGRDLWPREMLQLRAGKAPEGPLGVIFVHETQDVADALAISREQGVAIVPYADGSGVCGAARALRNSLVLDMKGLNRILSLDEKSQIVRVQAGVQGEKLERELNAKGYTLGHFPSSIYTSTVGGWLSTRSAGQLSTKYGKIEDMVVSLEGVMPDGTVFFTPEVPRSAAGPDFKQLIVGAEGTLGIITAATLKVHRYPETREFLSFSFPTWKDACEAVREMLQRGLRPAVVRLYDEADTQLNASHMKLKVEGILGVFICEGEKRLTALEARRVSDVCRELGAKDMGQGPAQRWWDHRYDVSYNLSKVLPNPGMIIDTMEVAATWKDLPALYEQVRAALASEAMLVLCHLSHAYLTGASLYFSVVARATGKSKNADLETYDSLWQKALDAALSAGGTVSHHHGVGELKAPWMEREHGPFQELYVGLKNRLDPKGLLNPGKLVPTAKPAKKAPAKRPAKSASGKTSTKRKKGKPA